MYTIRYMGDYATIESNDVDFRLILKILQSSVLAVFKRNDSERTYTMMNRVIVHDESRLAQMIWRTLDDSLVPDYGDDE